MLCLHVLVWSNDQKPFWVQTYIETAMSSWLLAVVFCVPALHLAASVDVDSLCSRNDTLFVTAGLEQSKNTEQCDLHNQTCTSLQAAINFVVSGNHTLTERAIVCLQGNSIEHISNKTYFGNTDLQVVATRPVFVECSYHSNITQDVAGGADFTWYFNQSDTVTLINVHLRKCPYPIRIAGARTVLIQMCSFRNFGEAVLDIYNSESVSLHNVLFHSNVGTGTFLQSFRGNSGALALSYQGYSAHNTNPPRVQLCDCQFINNSALATSTFLTSEEALSRHIFTGRGGAIAVYINEHVVDVSIDIEDSTVVNSFARSYGGGVFIIINGRLPTQHTINFVRTNLSSNYGQLAGSGVFLGFLSSTSTVVRPHSVVFSECSFTNNTGLSGGGIYIITSFVGSRGNYFKFERCEFSRNRGVGSTEEFGAAISVALFTIFEERVSAVQHDIVDCIFSYNSGGNGIVSIGYAPVRFSGSNLFLGNTGAPLRVIGSVVDFEDEISFINNTVSNEGALSLLSFGQIRAHRGLSLSFLGNTGRVGASIVVFTPDSLMSFSRLINNPHCFLLFEDSAAVPSLWEEVVIQVSENSALLGSALFLSQLGPCSWSSNTQPYFDELSIRQWPLWKFGNNTDSGYPDSGNPDHYMATRAREILVRTSLVDAWPGQIFPMSVVGVDEFKQYTSTNAQFLQSLNNSLRFAPEISAIAGSFGSGLLADEFPVQYFISEESELSPQPATTILVDEPFETLPITRGRFQLVTEQCPGGYRLTSTGNSAQRDKTCSCLEASQIIACEANQDSLILKDGYWAGYVPSQSPNLFFHPCPPGYCQCTLNSSVGPERCVYLYTHTNQDLQCIAQRQGLLCGSCRNSSGVSVLLNKCVSCSNGFISIVIALIALDAVVITIIILTDRPIGLWIYPFIFYIQITPYLSEYFPESFATLGVYMTYLKSAVGFYFVYDFCLLENLPPLASYTLRYTPSVTALIVFSSVQMARKFFPKKRPLQHHGCWLMLLLLYPQLVHTSLSLLNCPRLTDSSGSTLPRWFVDASVQCFTGWHIPLALVAVITLLLCLISVIALFVFAFRRLERVEKILVPVRAAYSNETQWWSGVELGRRLLLIAVPILSPLNTVYAILLLVSVLSATAFFSPYKSLVVNAVEILLLISLLILLLLDATPVVKEFLFTFGVGLEVSPISWVLFTLYYIPVLALVGVLVVVVAHKIHSYFKRSRQTKRKGHISDLNNSFIEDQQPVPSQLVDITNLQQSDTHQT